MRSWNRQDIVNNLSIIPRTIISDQTVMSNANLIGHFGTIDILSLLASWSGQTSLYLALIKMHLEGQT